MIRAGRSASHHTCAYHRRATQMKAGDLISLSAKINDFFKCAALMKAANAFGLTVPQSVQVKADDDVIE